MQTLVSPSEGMTRTRQVPQTAELQVARSAAGLGGARKHIDNTTLRGGRGFGLLGTPFVVSCPMPRRGELFCMSSPRLTGSIHNDETRYRRKEKRRESTPPPVSHH